MDKKITKLAIFDFDQTLINTPTPEIGKKLYQEKTGNPWPYEGWWGRKESLDMDIFEFPIVEDVIEDYKKEIVNENTAVVLLTGRMVKLGDQVIKILHNNGLVFDHYRFNKGGATEVAKIKSMEGLLEKYPDVNEIALWDDRLAHIPIFQSFGDGLIASGRLKYFNITVVPTEEGGTH